jgi:hypothetical protein
MSRSRNARNQGLIEDPWQFGTAAKGGASHVIYEWALALIVGAAGGLLSASVEDPDRLLILPAIRRNAEKKWAVDPGFLLNAAIGAAAAFAIWGFSGGAGFAETKLSAVRLAEAFLAGVAGWPLIKLVSDRRLLQEVDKEKTDAVSKVTNALLRERAERASPETIIDRAEEHGRADKETINE